VNIPTWSPLLKNNIATECRKSSRTEGSPGHPRLSLDTCQFVVIYIHNMNVHSGERLRDRLRASTRQAILDAAQTVFERGVARARMEDVAAEAGVAVGTLYNHFTDRRSLFEAVMEARQAEFRAAMDASVAHTESEPFEKRLECFFLSALALLERHRMFLLAAREYEEESCRFSRGPALRALRESAGVLVTKALETGELRSDEGDLYPLIIVGILRGAAGAVALGETREPLDRLSRRLAQCFLKGAVAT
jgi:AcrR family transcriptional regulator